jgi:hypothetical protein
MKKYLSILFIATISLSASAQLVYKDVAAIFYNRCTSCHHENQLPKSMMNYSEIYPQAYSILADLKSGKMPPWSADTTYTRFLHERIITLTEKNAIINWINSGGQKGDTTLAPKAPTYTKYQLKGKPDLVLQIPTFSSNATTGDVYNCFSLPSNLPVDRIMRAVEIVPGNPNIVHHVVVSVDTTNTVTSNLNGGCFTQPGDFNIIDYAPGSPPIVFPGQAQLKMGTRIKANSRIVLQIHYPVGTAGMLDSTQIRFYFYPLNITGIRPAFYNTLLTNWLMNIPANTTATYTAQYPTIGTLPLPVSVFGVWPHAHTVNRSMVIYGFKASPVDTIKLVRVPNWNFDLQDNYVYPRMVKIPSGYKFGAKHFYDNTTNNPYNPSNPPKLVKAGPNTTDEMLFDSFIWSYYKTGDELINIGDLLASDTLLSTISVKEVAQTNIQSYFYPNPVNESATLIVLNEQVSNCNLKIFDIYGKEVSLEVTRNADSFNISRGNMPSGVYFYTLNAGRFSGSGKIILIPK